MSTIEWMWLYSMGVRYMSMIHKVVVNLGYMKAICERWDSSTNTFHLPIRECMVTLEDVWQILGFLWRVLHSLDYRMRLREIQSRSRSLVNAIIVYDGVEVNFTMSMCITMES